MGKYCSIAITKWDDHDIYIHIYCASKCEKKIIKCIAIANVCYVLHIDVIIIIFMDLWRWRRRRLRHGMCTMLCAASAPIASSRRVHPIYIYVYFLARHFGACDVYIYRCGPNVCCHCRRCHHHHHRLHRWANAATQATHSSSTTFTFHIHTP